MSRTLILIRSTTESVKVRVSLSRIYPTGLILISGQLTLRKLKLKKGALDKFQLPVDVLEGICSKPFQRRSCTEMDQDIWGSSRFLFTG